MTEKTVYTAIFGNYQDPKTGITTPYDDLKTPTIVTPGWRYICYTDQILTDPVWEIKQIDLTMEPQRMARYIKLMFHKFVYSEYSLWLDASFQININLELFWARCFKSPFTAPAHPIRNCVYREVASCIANRRGDEVEIFNQGEEYKRLKVPAFNGIITSGVLMRQKTEGCIKMCEEWWEELSNYSARDQIAFANISRGWKFNTFKWDYSQSRELKYIKHFKHRH